MFNKYIGRQVFKPNTNVVFVIFKHNMSFQPSRIMLLIGMLSHQAAGYFDMGTTTLSTEFIDEMPRQSFFRWQRIEFGVIATMFWLSNQDIWESNQRRRLCVVAGVSIDFTPLGVAAILNARTLLTFNNYLNEWTTRQRDLRIWALGRRGAYNTPYRYRVWRVVRLFPRSLNPEHWHGPRDYHQPRHDVSIIHTMDKMYIYSSRPWKYMYAYRAFVCDSHERLWDELWHGGTGFESRIDIKENYKIKYFNMKKSSVVDCSKYLPKWWGKFICIKHHGLPGVSNGGGLFQDLNIVGVGCFEIRYNEDRILVFSDLRYYAARVQSVAYIDSGTYYEYAYPQWAVKQGWFWDDNSNTPHLPGTYLTKMYPMGKK